MEELRRERGFDMLPDNKMQIRFSVMYLRLELTEDAFISGSRESVLRGGIGDALLEQYCIRNGDCGHCSFASACIVQNFMYAHYKKKPDFVTTGESLGFVLSAEDDRQEYRKGEQMSFVLTLFGDAIVYLNPVIQAIHMLGMKGIGRSHAHYRISEICNRKGGYILKDGTVYCDNYLTEILQDYVNERKTQLVNPGKLIFQKPLTIKYKSEFIREFDIRAIINGVTRRIYMLECYEGNDVEEVHFYENLPQVLGQYSQRYQVRRYSSRKQQFIIMKGIVGEIKIAHVSDDILEYLIAGEITHIGKNTRFGFGKYKIV